MPIGSRFFEPMEVTVIVLLRKEARLSIDPSLLEVLRYFSEFDAWATWHDSFMKIKRC
jgi:hypothetical protein